MVMHQLSSYRGQRINVISSSDNRFEGWLKDVFPEAQIISVEKVRFWGTESRRPDKHVAARREIYGLIRLQLCHAKEISVDIDSADIETIGTGHSMLSSTARLENKETGAVPPQTPSPDRAASDQEAILDVPTALRLLSEALQQEDKPHMSFISRGTLVRYEGTLESLDPDQRLLGLSNVHSLGTEDRGVKKPVAPGAKQYDSVKKCKLDRMQSIRIHVAMYPDVLEDAAVIAHEGSAGIIELDAECPFPIQPSLLHNNMGQPLHVFKSAEPAQNDSGQESHGGRSEGHPGKTVHQDVMDSLFNAPEPRPGVRKARRNFRAHKKAQSSKKVVCADDVTAPISQKPSSTADSSSGYAGSHRSSSVNLDDQQTEKRYNMRKRMASVTPRKSSRNKTKKGRKHSVTNDGQNVSTSETGSDRQLRNRNPVKVSDVVQSVKEPNDDEAMERMLAARDQIFEQWMKRLNEIDALIQERLDSAYEFGSANHRRFQPGEMTIALCQGVFYQASIVRYYRTLPVRRKILNVDNPTVWTCFLHYHRWSKKQDEEHMEVELLSQGVDTANIVTGTNDVAGMLFAHEWNTCFRMQRGMKEIGRGAWSLSDENFTQLERYWTIHGGMDVSFAEYSGRRQAEAALASLTLDGENAG